MKIHETHNIRTDDDEKSYCLLCGNAGKELTDECPDVDPLIESYVRDFDEEYSEDYTRWYYEHD